MDLLEMLHESVWELPRHGTPVSKLQRIPGTKALTTHGMGIAGTQEAKRPPARDHCHAANPHQHAQHGRQWTLHSRFAHSGAPTTSLAIKPELRPPNCKILAAKMEQTDPHAAHKIHEGANSTIYFGTLCEDHGISFGPVCIACQDLAYKRTKPTNKQSE